MDYTFTNFESDVSSFITLKKDIISLVNFEKKKIYLYNEFTSILEHIETNQVDLIRIFQYLKTKENKLTSLSK